MKRLLLLCLALLGGVVVAAELAGSMTGEERPNILWITSEDNGPQLGCYGDEYANTPNLDRLAARGLVYRNAWSNAPVCAPARTTIISGVYPTSTGSQHMRSKARLPAGMKMFPQLLREAGYYTTNNSKEDYNLEKTGQVWDVSSGKAHWRDRPEGAPFFAVFNLTVTHESRVRNRPHEAIHDPAGVRIPAYHPDTPEVRRDWAQYHDRMTEMDARVGKRLVELEEAGLADSTIVVYFGDHGPGLPRSKRFPYDSGLRVPLIVHLPERYRHLATKEYQPGGETERLVAFVDLAPTVLSLAGVSVPEWMQGGAFLGDAAAPPHEYLHGFRGRMDERVDLVRSVRDQRFVYLRNYLPHRIYGQHVDYMFQTPTTRVWKELYDAGKLEPPRTFFWERKPPEELYDLAEDPDEVVNLAGDPDCRETLERFRRVQREHVLSIRDLGFLPESEIGVRAGESTPYEMGRDPERYPLSRILDAAELASGVDLAATGPLADALEHDDSAVRYWGAVGLLALGKPAVTEIRVLLRGALEDPSAAVRISAAEALGRFGADEDLEPALATLLAAASLESNDVFTCILALNAIDYLDEQAATHRADLELLPREQPGMDGRLKSYVPRLIEEILRGL